MLYVTRIKELYSRTQKLKYYTQLEMIFNIFASIVNMHTAAIIANLLGWWDFLFLFYLS